jgi:hypothetical protein
VTPWRELHVSEGSWWVAKRAETRRKMHLDTFERAIKEIRWILHARDCPSEEKGPWRIVTTVSHCGVLHDPHDLVSRKICVRG